MSDYVFTDRYDALGIPRPDLRSMCRGQCEGTGLVPIQRDHPADTYGDWPQLWADAEKKEHSDDGWHFVACPTCNGTGRQG